MKTILLLTLCLFTSLSFSALKPRPKLVVFLIFDQMRSDLLTRFYSETKSNVPMGYRYLLDNAAWYPTAEYQLLQNMTGPGHATLLSGAYPYRSGIALNAWFDADKKSPVYCVDDKENGMSPKNLIGSSLGDEVKGAFPKSRVVSIAIKDRSAILMGGHRPDYAVWLEPKKFNWVTSSYYSQEGKLPDWAQSENERVNKIKNDLVGFKRPSLLAGLSSVFPQGLYWKDKATLATPAGLELTEKLAMKAFEQLKLGNGTGTDFLLISFSSHDYAGHAYGPESAAIQEMLKAEDAMVSRILSTIQTKVPGGLKNTLVVLSSDHGVGPNPEWAKINRLGGGRFVEAEVQKTLNKALIEKYGNVDEGWVHQVKEVNVYLNRAAALKKGVDFAEVQAFTKTILQKEPGIETVFTESDYHNRRLPPGLWEKQILNSYYPGRSGHVVGILKPFYISSDDTAGHETGYSYDRTVPLAFLGRDIRPGIYSQSAEIADIAPTVAHLLGTLPPSNSHGRVLAEIIRR